MKRDPDLIREILLQTEADDGASQRVHLSLDSYALKQVSYHVLLLTEAGFIAAVAFGDNWEPVRLTWEGHEFLDAARDNTRWNEVKRVMGKTGGFVVSVAQQVLIELAKSQALKYLP